MGMIFIKWSQWNMKLGVSILRIDKAMEFDENSLLAYQII